MHIKIVSRFVTFIVDWISFLVNPVMSFAQRLERKLQNDYSDRRSESTKESDFFYEDIYDDLNDMPINEEQQSCHRRRDDKANEDKVNDPNNNNRYDNSRHKNPIITNYYCYDQRVFNIYRVNDRRDDSSRGFSVFETIRSLHWKWWVVMMAVAFAGTLFFCYLGVDLLSWFIFHKVFDSIINDHLVIVRTNAPA